MIAITLGAIERVDTEPCEVCGCHSHDRLSHGELVQLGAEVMTTDEYNLRAERAPAAS